MGIHIKTALVFLILGPRKFLVQICIQLRQAHPNFDWTNTIGLDYPGVPCLRNAGQDHESDDNVTGSHP